MITWILVFLGRVISRLSKTLNLGAGGTWPGEVALKFDPNILSKIAPENTILIAGTNGKTTTALMIKTILENSGVRVIHNASGANLLNGIVSAIITSPGGDWGVFEVDENALPVVAKFIKSIKCIVLLNLFRDQLDRYGEVDSIAKKWMNLPNTTNFLVNGDDPQLAWIGKNFTGNVVYFGLGDKKFFLPRMQHATDSIFCPSCGERLKFTGVYFSHLGQYHCDKCGFAHPKNDLENKGGSVHKEIEGTYNLYNFLAAESVAKILKIEANFSGFKPAFGRQEQIGNTRILLSKNPAGFNESLRTVLATFARGGLANGVQTIQLLLVLNDRVPDGRDVSWIWDVDFEMIPNNISIGVSGDRALDLALRLKYAGLKTQVVDLAEGAKKAQNILATYSAMLEVRKILTGHKIL